jgi:transposase-like protein
MSNEIKPCPFCGCTKVVHSLSHVGFWKFTCPDCFAVVSFLLKEGKQASYEAYQRRKDDRK